MKILVLSFYFRPDLSAGSFRTTALVDAMSELVPCESQIDVITSLPNRYRSFTAEAPRLEEQPGLSVFRIPLREHQSGMIDQSQAFFFFARHAIQRADLGEYDVVFATSSRLMTAVLGAWIARRKKAKLYLDIRDILVENIRHIVPRAASSVTRPVLALLERWAISRADQVNLVSPGFAEYFTGQYPRRRFSFFTNGIDDEFLAAVPAYVETYRHHTDAPDRPLTVLYAGNIGEGQGLHVIVPPLAKRMDQRVHFKIIGDGGRRKALENALAMQRVTNVELVPPVERTELIRAYRDADVLFLHLNDYESFKKVLPSKLFEYAAVGKPVWAGVSGYAAKFVKSEISNAAVFHPCHVDGAVQAFTTLTLQDTPRVDFLAKYARENISRQMATDVISLAVGEG